MCELAGVTGAAYTSHPVAPCERAGTEPRMQLTILSRGAAIHTTRRLAEATRALGHRPRVVDPLALQMGLGVGGPSLFLDKRPLARTDVVIPRIAQSINVFGLALVNQFHAMGVPVLNDAVSIAQSRNKMRLMQLLSSRGVPVPPTVMGRGALELRAMVDLVGGLPVIIKLVQGAERYGIIVCESVQSTEAALETVLSMGHNLIVQRYVKPSEGRDLRALVVAGEVVAAVRRRPLAGKLRHTLGAGATVTRVRLTAEQERVAIDAAQVVGLEVAAVDLLDLKHDGPKVFEVHSSPGLRELEAATGKDLAAPIVERALALAREHRQLQAMERRRKPRGPQAGAAIRHPGR